MTRTVVAALLALALAGPASAAGTPSAPDLLEKVGATYRGLTSYEFRGNVSIHVSGTGTNQGIDMPVVAAAERPGRTRLELQNPQMGLLVVTDGAHTWSYLTQAGKYTKKPYAAAPDTGAAAPLLPQGSPIARYFTPANGLRGASVVGQETLVLNGRSAPCWIVHAEFTPPGTMAADTSAHATSVWWIDQARSVILRDSTSLRIKNPQTGQPLEMTQLTSYAVARLDEKLEDSLFAFQPPAGAQEVSDLQAPSSPAGDLVGQKAPPFTLKDTKGRSVSLAAFKGKVVVLDFWATWCKPCRIEMPRVAKLHKELRLKGLVVIGVNFAESAATVSKFLAANPYTFTIVLDEKGDISAQYKADAIPTLVVIGRDGLIKSYFQGVRDESVLREAVAKAGIR